MTDQTKWYVLWGTLFTVYSVMLYNGGYYSGSEIDNCRKLVLEDMAKDLEFNVSVKQMVSE